MRILISNDDGISSTGISVLEEIAKTLSDDVWVVAPQLDQSGVSHALTIRDPLRIKTIHERKYSVNGTPSDCVMSAVTFLLKDKRPDLVLSGINHGSNLAEDVIYSGTVAAAIEGSLMKIPAIAISLTTENKRPPQWDVARVFVKDIVLKLLSLGHLDHIIYNVNLPNIPVDQVKGIRVTNQGKRIISENDIVERIDPIGVPYYWLGSAEYRSTNIWEHATPGTDLDAIGHRCISITPLSLDLTHKESKGKLEALFV